jgi:hypothetical protein
MPTTLPIPRLAFEMCDGKYDNPFFPNQVDNSKGKLLTRLATRVDFSSAGCGCDFEMPFQR